MFEHPWSGVFAATLCPFKEDYCIDEEGLRTYARYLASVDGIKGLVCNGHTGEVMGLRTAERVRVTQIFADEVGHKVKTVSGICTEGSFEAIDHALAAKEAGAEAILLMPPHHWLRFGRDSKTAVVFFEDVGQGADLPIIVAPDVPVLTCHDEYLLESLLAGADGALVGFAGFVPELICELVRTALSGDLAGARRVQESVYPLAKLVYRFGEPSGDAHQRMKAAMTLQGRFPSMVVRPPLRPLSDEEMQRIEAELAAADYQVALGG